MFTMLSKKMNKKRKGFTLIELVVVIAILGILVAIAAPRLIGFTTDAAENADNASLRTVESATSVAIADGLFDYNGTGWVEADGTAIVADTDVIGMLVGPFLDDQPVSAVDDTKDAAVYLRADGTFDVVFD